MALTKLNRTPSSDVMGVLESITAGTFYGRIKFAWTGDDLDYKGYNVTYLADGTETNWVIFKFTWTTGNPVDIQIQTGVWNDRVSLDW